MQNPLHYATCRDESCLLCASERAAASVSYSVARRRALADTVGDKQTPAAVALVLALAGLMIWPLALIGLPVALYATRGRNGHRPLGHGRAVTAAALASLELAGLIILIIATATYHPSI